MSYSPEDSHFKTSDIPVDIEVGTARGLRSFDVDAKGRLESVTRKYIWKPGENVAKRETDYNRYTGREKTTPTTFHGFYSFHDGTDEYRSKDRISGVVENYGEVFIGERGFRSEKAKIVALHLPGSGNILSFYAKVVGGILAMAGLTVFLAYTPAWILGALTGLLVILGLIVFGANLIADISEGNFNKSVMSTNEKVKLAYGDNVEYFTSRKKMLKKYPLYQYTINPDDPKFWE